MTARDFTNLTCTNLMIKLKVLTKKLPPGEQLEFITTREGHDNVHKAFRKNFDYTSREEEPNRWWVRILKPN